MDERSSSATAALEIMRQWEWQRFDRNGAPCDPWEELREVVNRLALDGLSKPDMIVLDCLCRGELVARGNFHWRKFEENKYFHMEKSKEKLPFQQWKNLSSTIEKLNEKYPHSHTNLFLFLPKIGIDSCRVYEWEFAENRFNVASGRSDVPPPLSPEEWFSAWDIDIYPTFVPSRNIKKTLPRSPPAPNKGGRPPVADWEAAALEMAGRYYRGDLKPKTIAEVARALSSWLAEQDSHPSDSVVHTHAKRIFAAFRSWEGD